MSDINTLNNNILFSVSKIAPSGNSLINEIQSAGTLPTTCANASNASDSNFANYLQFTGPRDPKVSATLTSLSFSPSGNLSLSLWVNWQYQQSLTLIFRPHNLTSLAQLAASQTMSMTLSADGNWTYIKGNKNTSGKYYSSKLNFFQPQNQWVHIVWNISLNQNTTSLYIDGEKLSIDYSSIQGSPYFSFPLSTCDLVLETGTIKLANLKMFNQTLTQDEITQVRNQDLTPTVITESLVLSAFTDAYTAPISVGNGIATNSPLFPQAHRFNGNTLTANLIGYQVNSLTQFTASLWVKIDSRSLSNTLTLLQGQGFSLQISKTYITWTIGSTSIQFFTERYLGEWHLLTLTATLSNNQMTLQCFLDGAVIEAGWEGVDWSDSQSISNTAPTLPLTLGGEILIGNNNFIGQIAQLTLWQNSTPTTLNNLWATNFESISSLNILQLNLSSSIPTNSSGNNIPLLFSSTPTIQKDAQLQEETLVFNNSLTLSVLMRKKAVSTPTAFTLACWLKFDTTSLQPYNNGKGTPQIFLLGSNNNLSIHFYKDKFIWQISRYIQQVLEYPSTFASNQWTMWAFTAQLNTGNQMVTLQTWINGTACSPATSTNITDQGGQVLSDQYSIFVDSSDFAINAFPKNAFPNLTLGTSFTGSMASLNIWQTYLSETNERELLAPLFIPLQSQTVAEIPLNAANALADISPNQIPTIPVSIGGGGSSLYPLFPNICSFNTASRLSINFNRFVLTKPNIVFSFWANINFSTLNNPTTIISDSGGNYSLTYTGGNLSWKVGSLTATTYAPTNCDNLWKLWAFSANIVAGQISLQIWMNGEQVTSANPQSYASAYLPKLNTITLGSSNFSALLTNLKISQFSLTTTTAKAFFPQFQTLTSDLVWALEAETNSVLSDGSGNNLPTGKSSTWNATVNESPLLDTFILFPSPSSASIVIDGTQTRLASTNEVTLAAWVNISSNQGGILFTTLDNKMQVTINSTGITWQADTGKSVTYNALPNQWILCTFTAQVTDDKLNLQIWQNGVAVTEPTAMPYTGTLPSLAQNLMQVGFSFGGSFAKPTIWQKALTGAEIQDYYYQTIQQSLVLSLSLAENTQDISGNNIPIEVTGTPSTTTDPTIGSVLSFENLQINYFTSLLTNPNQLSICFWAKLPKSIGSNAVLVKQAPTYFQIQANPIKWTLQGATALSNYTQYLTGKWHFFCLTAELASKTITQQIYIDGILVNTNTTSYNYESLPPIYPYNIKQPNGIKLFQFQQYQNVLSPTTIQSIYQSIAAKMATKPLLAFFQFDADLNDQGANQLTPTWTSAPSSTVSDPLGVFNNCLQLTGSTTFALPLDSLLIQNQAVLTIDFWAHAAYSTAATNFLTSSNSSIAIALPNASTQASFSVNGLTAQGTITPSNLAASWQHWTFVASWANNTLSLEIYLNGTALSGASTTGTAPFPTLNTLTLFSGFTGYISHLRIWQTALNSTQITELMELDKAAFPSELPSALPAPISFTLLDGNQNPNIFITDDTGSLLELSIHNEAAYPIVIHPINNFNKDTFNPTSDPYNFQLKFRPGTLKQKGMSLASSDDGWNIVVQEQSDQTLSIFFIYTGSSDITLYTPSSAKNNPHLKTSIHLHLQNVVALPSSEGARTTKAELQYNHLNFQNSPEPLTGFLLYSLNVINHLGLKDIGLNMGFWGSNTILNDGSTPNVLILHLTNSGSSNIQFTTSSKLFLSVSSIEEFGLPSSLTITTADSTSIGSTPLANVQQNPTSFAASSPSWTASTPSKEPYPGYNTWTLSPVKNPQTLAAGQSLFIIISGIKTSTKDGTASIFLRYTDLQDANGNPYWDGYQEFIVNKSPLLIQDSGIKVNGPISTNNALTSTGNISSQGSISDANGVIPPVGTIIMWYGVATKIPKGWYLCDGSFVNARDNKELYEVISGQTYSESAAGGLGFYLPNFENKFPYGGSSSSIIINQSNLRATTGGNDSHTLLQSDLPNHTHKITIDSAGEHTHKIATEDDHQPNDIWVYETGNTEGSHQVTNDAGAQPDGLHTHNASMSQYCRGGNENTVSQTSIPIIPPYVRVLFLIKY